MKKLFVFVCFVFLSLGGVNAQESIQKWQFCGFESTSLTGLVNFYKQNGEVFVDVNLSGYSNVDQRYDANASIESVVLEFGDGICANKFYTYAGNQEITKVIWPGTEIGAYYADATGNWGEGYFCDVYVSINYSDGTSDGIGYCIKCPDELLSQVTLY